MAMDSSASAFSTFSLTVSIEEGAFLTKPNQPDFDGSVVIRVSVNRDSFKTSPSSSADWNESFTFNEVTWSHRVSLSAIAEEEFVGHFVLELTELQSRFKSKELAIFYGWVELPIPETIQTQISRCSLKISLRVNPGEQISYKRNRTQSSLSYKMLGSTGDPYDEQEQTNAFTSWMNITLAPVGIVVTNLFEDIKYGTVLIRLMECLTKRKMTTRFWEKAKTRMQMIENVKLAFQKITEYGVKLVGCNIEDVVDGNKKIILGLIWSIVRQSQSKALKDISDQMQMPTISMDIKTFLLDWLKDSTDVYSGTAVNDLTSSFQDGLLFCALINAHRPDLIDYDNMLKVLPIERLTCAFKAMEVDLGLGKFQNPMDFLKQTPDEKAMMTYLWSLHQKLGASDTEDGHADKASETPELWRDLVDLCDEIDVELAIAESMYAY